MKRNTLINGMFECNGGKKGFVLGVCTVLTFATMLLFGCSNLMTSLDGIYRAAGNVPTLPATPPVNPPKAPDIGGSSSENEYYFYIDGEKLNDRAIKISGDVKFSKIKEKIQSDIDDIEAITGFLYWENKATGAKVASDDVFSASTEFVAKYSESLKLVVYAFNDKDGYPLGTARLRGEVTFDDIKKKAGRVLDTFIEGEAGFLGWIVDGNVTLVKAGDKYSSATTFVATYEKYRKIDVPDLCDGYVWYSEKDMTYLVFDDSMGIGGTYSVLNNVTSSKEAKDTILDYALYQRAVENAENKWKAANPGTLVGLNSDPDVEKAKADLAEFENDNFVDTGYNWWVCDDTTFGMMTADFSDYSTYSLHLDFSGKTIVNDDGDVLFTRM